MTWIDSLRLLAGLSMVGLHATADPSGQPWPDYAVTERIGPIVIRGLLYIARTELFIIISVFLLVLALDRRPRSYQTVMSEQTRRLLIPFAFWTVFYAGYNFIKADAFGYAPTLLATVSDPISWIGFALLGDVKYHMHFIPTLFGVLIFFPLYQRAAAFPWLGLAVGLGLVVKLHLDAFLYQTFWGTEALPYLVRVAKVLSYVGYGLAAGAAYGLLKTHGGRVLQGWVPALLLSGGVLLLFKAIAAYKTILSGSYPFTYQPGYWADFLMPVFLFLICMCLSARAWPPILTKLAPYSFGMYLCHPIFLDLMEIALRDTAFSPAAQVTLKIAVILPATALCVFGLGHAKPLAWTIGLGGRHAPKSAPQKDTQHAV